MLQDDLGLSYLFIAHDLPLARDFAHPVVVMQNGRIVEQGPVAQIFDAPREASTRNLIGCILAVVEISLGFDNAVVNANVLKTMTPEWQRRLLTWGTLIAVFGMRIIFPLAVVVIAANIGHVSAVVLAATEPQEYARIMNEAHIGITVFGGTFRMMVALNYFMDQSKDVDWIKAIECHLRSLASIRGLEIAVVLFAVMMLASALPPP